MIFRNICVVIDMDNGGFTMVKDHTSIQVDAIDVDQRQRKCKIEERYRIANFDVEK